MINILNININHWNIQEWNYIKIIIIVADINKESKIIIINNVLLHHIYQKRVGN